MNRPTCPRTNMPPVRRCAPHRPRHRRGFNLVELLLALSITSALLTATMVALDASFRAYQMTAESSSMHTVSRLSMHRMLALIRTGDEFGPFPTNPAEPVIESTYIEFIAPNGQLVVLDFDVDESGLFLEVHERADEESPWVLLSRNLLLGGVIAQYDGGGVLRSPFTLEYAKGKQLHRATIDLTVAPDTAHNLEFDGDNADKVIRLVGSAMPRSISY